MRKLLLLVLLMSGCASEAQGPTDSQKAIWAYFAGLCGQRADYSNIEYLLRTDAALRGCVTMHAIQADAENRARRDAAWSDFGAALQHTPRPSGSTCTSRPDGLGGIRTYCD